MRRTCLTAASIRWRNIFCNAINRTPSGTITSVAGVLQNIGGIETSGVDLNLDLALAETGIGQFRVQWLTSFLLDYDELFVQTDGSFARSIAPGSSWIADAWFRGDQVDHQHRLDAQRLVGAPGFPLHRLADRAMRRPGGGFRADRLLLQWSREQQARQRDLHGYAGKLVASALDDGRWTFTGASTTCSMRIRRSVSPAT